MLGRNSADGCKVVAETLDTDLAQIGVKANAGLQNLPRGEGGWLRPLCTSGQTVMRLRLPDGGRATGESCQN